MAIEEAEASVVDGESGHDCAFVPIHPMHPAFDGRNAHVTHIGWGRGRGICQRSSYKDAGEEPDKVLGVLNNVGVMRIRLANLTHETVVP